MGDMQAMGNVTDEEAYKTWNMGVGGILIVKREKGLYEQIKNIAKDYNIETWALGNITSRFGKVIKIENSWGIWDEGVIDFEIK